MASRTDVAGSNKKRRAKKSVARLFFKHRIGAGPFSSQMSVAAEAAGSDLQSVGFCVFGTERHSRQTSWGKTQASLA